MKQERKFEIGTELRVCKNRNKYVRNIKNDDRT